MRLLLERQVGTANSTIGKLSIDGEFECWTLEDVVRPEGVKVYGQTAIPAGTYEVQITMSPRFKVRMPLLIGVPGFEGVRIHTGNTHKDTEGCILVGRDKGADSIMNSRLAMDALMGKLEVAQASGEFIEIEIRQIPKDGLI